MQRKLVLLALAVVFLDAPAVALADTTPDKLLPDATEGVLCINIRSLLASPLYQKYAKEQLESALQNNERFTAIMKAMGLDPLKDFSQVYVSSSKVKIELIAPGAPPKTEGDAFIVVKGAFDVQKINTAAGALTAADPNSRTSSSAYGQFTIFETTPPEGDKKFYSVLLDKETAVMSTSKEQLTDAIERSLGKKTGKLSAAFAAALAKADVKQAVWGVGLIPESVKELGKQAPQGGEMLEKLDAINMSLNITAGVTFSLNLFTSDADVASQLKAAFEQAKQFAGTMALGNEQIGAELSDLINGLSISESGKQVSIRLDASAELMDKIIAKTRR